MASATSSRDKQRLIAAMVEFLKGEAQADGVSEAGAESIEVAIQCLQTAFNVDGDNPELLPSRPLLDIFTKGDVKEPAKEPSEEDKRKAEALKNEGNELMKNAKYHEAIHKYDEAIKCHQSAVYYCNRAAAYSKLDRHEFAVDDCKKALQLDSSYSKAYGRMGLAYSCMNQHREARDCYKKALDLEPTNESFKNNLEIAEAKLAEAGGNGSGAQMPGMPGGMGGMFGGVDFGSFLSNPGLMNMAAQLMSDPNMQNMMFSLAGSAMNQPSGQQGLGSLLNVGQRLAEQMQQSNPELVEQLRRQFQSGAQPDGSSNPGGPGANPPGSNPPPS